MKKYVKPDLFYENFELSKNIASCNVQDDDPMSSATLGDGNSCTYPDTGLGTILFTGSNRSCEFDYRQIEEYCYQSNTDGFTFFHS